MPITLDNLKKDVRTCTVEYNGETAQVTYRPSGYTPEVEDRFQTYVQSSRSSNGFAEFLAGILISWDLLDDNGKEFPIELEDLRTLPGRFLTIVVNAITADMQEANDENRKNSGAGSLRAVSKGNRRNGTR